VLDTTLSPRELLDGLLAIERGFGRDRAAEAGRWGPRVLDLDLLLHGDAVVHAPGLDVPHPHLHVRAFALVPLVEAWPDAVIPGLGPARDALAGVARDGIQALS
jgi:2-amino-4-hydroxy-6-hydroxymethyldihydropteridine diphosphokinase